MGCHFWERGERELRSARGSHAKNDRTRSCCERNVCVSLRRSRLWQAAAQRTLSIPHHNTREHAWSAALNSSSLTALTCSIRSPLRLLLSNIHSCLHCQLSVLADGISLYVRTLGPQSQSTNLPCPMWGCRSANGNKDKRRRAQAQTSYVHRRSAGRCMAARARFARMQLEKLFCSGPCMCEKDEKRSCTPVLSSALLVHIATL